MDNDRSRLRPFVIEENKYRQRLKNMISDSVAFILFYFFVATITIIALASMAVSYLWELIELNKEIKALLLQQQ